MSRMAKAAKAMTPADLGQRLPAPGSGDELDDLGGAFNDLLDRLNEAFIRLNEAYERQSRFAGDASHQLRTPIAALLGQVQVALRRDRSTDEYKRFLGRVESEGMRLRQVIESLLFLAQPGGAQLEPAVINLREWVPDHLRRWAVHGRAADLHAEMVGDDSLFVQVQPALLGQIVDNLLENACKYTQPGTAITVRAWRENGTVAVGVEDRGSGLNTAELPRVFEPFFRGDSARRDGQPGVGLGLAVARRIAASSGGTLDVESSIGAGCLFVLRLPGTTAKTQHDDDTT